MSVETQQERYDRQGYLALDNFVPETVARAFTLKLQGDFAQSGVDLLRQRKQSALLAQEAVEVYGFHYAPMIAFLWGMTPAVQKITGRNLLPTYSYFRIYRKGDICRVHSDRYACEHSISLLLAASDNQPWPLEVGYDAVVTPKQMADESFGDRPFSAVTMHPGDAVLYQGVHRLHGRTTPNPNRWSAHLFLHWVDADGPYAEHAFDGQKIPERLVFAL